MTCYAGARIHLRCGTVGCFFQVATNQGLQETNLKNVVVASQARPSCVRQACTSRVCAHTYTRSQAGTHRHTQVHHYKAIGQNAHHQSHVVVPADSEGYSNRCVDWRHRHPNIRDAAATGDTGTKHRHPNIRDAAATGDTGTKHRHPNIRDAAATGDTGTKHRHPNIRDAAATCGLKIAYLLVFRGNQRPWCWWLVLHNRTTMRIHTRVHYCVHVLKGAGEMQSSNAQQSPCTSV